MLRLVIETFLFLFFAPFVFGFKVGTSNASSNALISSEYHETHKVKLVVDFSASYEVTYRLEGVDKYFFSEFIESYRVHLWDKYTLPETCNV